MTPFVFLSSDAGIVTSFVAALEQPGLFTNDVLLSNFTNFRYYLAFHPLLIYLLQKVTGDYGSAYISLLLALPFAEAAGFYLLGRLLFNDKYLAFLLSLMTLFPIALPVREFWGIYDDPLPRSLFHAYLPFLLAGFFYYRSNVRMLPVLMVALGIGFYTHPVSVPGWALGIWLSIWLFLPETWSLVKRAAYMLGLGLIFVATVAPWAANFLFVHDNAGNLGIKYEDVVEIISNRVGPELLSVRLALELWKDEVFSGPLALYFFAAIGLSAAVVYKYKDIRREFAVILVWIIGILFVALGLTCLEESICAARHVRRLQMDSVRGVKYPDSFNVTDVRLAFGRNPEPDA